MQDLPLQSPLVSRLCTAFALCLLGCSTPPVGTSPADEDDTVVVADTAVAVPDATPEIDVLTPDVERELPDELPEGACLSGGDCNDCEFCSLGADGMGVCLRFEEPACSPDFDTCPFDTYCRPYFSDSPQCGGKCVPFAFFPECEARGGFCSAVESVTSACPGDGYAPFSGSGRACPTLAGFRICCVQNPIPGSPCESSDDCGDTMECFREADGGPPGGACEQRCDRNLGGCPRWATCLPLPHIDGRIGRCVATCEDDRGCPSRLGCEPIATHPEDYESSEQVMGCWFADGLAPAGQFCERDADCLSGLCAASPNGAMRCSSRCDSITGCPSAMSCHDGYCI